MLQMTSSSTAPSLSQLITDVDHLTSEVFGSSYNDVITTYQFSQGQLLNLKSKHPLPAPRFSLKNPRKSRKKSEAKNDEEKRQEIPKWKKKIDETDKTTVVSSFSSYFPEYNEDEKRLMKEIEEKF